jgi:TolB-like protein/Flp pilus assembly protein TadD
LIFSTFLAQLARNSVDFANQQKPRAAMSILGELKRRKIFQVIAVYSVVAWLVVQVITSIEGPLNLPDWVDTFVIVLLGLGFPVLLVVSWAFNVTPDGLVRDEGGEVSEKSSGRTIEFVLIGLVAVAVVWLLYRTEFSEAPQPTEPQLVAEVAAPDVLPNSIAVLPFANLSPDPNNAFFAAGIHDTILNELAKISDMHVISRSAMLRYADGMTPIPQVAEELRVGTVMEGSVQYANGRVLVTAQLIDPETNSHLWSENYDREFADIFAIQADIATQIAAAMRTELSFDERLDISKQMTSSPEAYAFYLRAMQLINWDFSPSDSTPEIHGLLDEAIRLDPEFARAFAVKANILSFNRSGQKPGLQFADRALEIDPTLGSAYAAKGHLHHRAMRLTQARESFDVALSLNPNDIDILDDYSRFLSANGEPEKSLRLAARVLELDPGRLTYFAGRQRVTGDLQGALQTYMAVIAAQPGDYSAHRGAALTELQMGNREAARSHARIASSLRSSEDDPAITVAQDAFRFGVLGLREEANELLDLLVAKVAQNPDLELDPTYWVAAYVGAGDFDSAFEHLKRVVDAVNAGYRSAFAGAFAVNTFNIPELEQPRFVELRKQLRYDIPGL